MINKGLSRLKKIAFGCLLMVGLFASMLLLGFIAIFILETFGGIVYIIFLILIGGFTLGFTMDD